LEIIILSTKMVATFLRKELVLCSHTLKTWRRE